MIIAYVFIGFMFLMIILAVLSHSADKEKEKQRKQNQIKIYNEMAEETRKLQEERKIQEKLFITIWKFTDAGKEFEKSKDIEGAIKCYTKVTEYISDHRKEIDHFPQFCFDRLAILYRKVKDYQKEIQIIELLINIKSEDHAEYLQNLSKKYDEQTMQDIYDAANQGVNFKDNRGWVIYNAAIGISKQEKRLERAKELLERSNNK